MDFKKLPTEYEYLLINNPRDLLEFRIKSVIYGISTKVMLRPNNKNNLRIIIKKAYISVNSYFSLFIYYFIL